MIILIFWVLTCYAGAKGIIVHISGSEDHQLSSYHRRLARALGKCDPMPIINSLTLMC